MPFTTLQVFSSYSLLKSTIRLNAYVETGKLLGYKQLALTDDGVLHGAVPPIVRGLQYPASTPALRG